MEDKPNPFQQNYRKVMEFRDSFVKYKPKDFPDEMFTSMLDPDNYPHEVHTTETEDGYILKLFRIQRRRTLMEPLGKPVVLLQHGVMDSADCWVVNTKEKSLGLILADHGYDVWLSNSRGNKYSNKHTNKNITYKDYFTYSFQQMGQYDVPANIDYILSKTKQPDLVYIGHSQGTTQMFAALSDSLTSEHINRRVSLFIALAPVCYLANQGIAPAKFLSKHVKGVNETAKFLSIWMLGHPNKNKDGLLNKSFQGMINKILPKACGSFLEVTDPEYKKTVDVSRMGTFMIHFPSGSSVRCFAHYGQLVNTDHDHPIFRKYDRGKKTNLEEYGSEEPAHYDLTLVNTKVRLFVGEKDTLGDVADNRALDWKLRSMGVDCKMEIIDDWGHMPFIWGSDPIPVFDKILKEIEDTLNSTDYRVGLRRNQGISDVIGFAEVDHEQRVDFELELQEPVEEGV